MLNALTHWSSCVRPYSSVYFEIANYVLMSSVTAGGCRECLKNNMWIIMFIIAILSLLVSVTGVIISATR